MLSIPTILRLLAFGFLWSVVPLVAMADEIDTRAATDSRAKPRPCRDEKGRFARCADEVAPAAEPPTERVVDPQPVPAKAPEPAASPQPEAEPVRAEEHFCFDKEQQPIPCPTFKLSIRAGGTFGAATDVSPDLGAAFTIRTWSELTRSDMGPKLGVRAGLGRLPDDGLGLEETQVFTAFDAAATIVQPLGQRILANLFARAGLASRLSTDDEPRDRLPGYFSFGVDLHTHDGDHFLQVGLGPDQRLSGDWALTVTVEGAVKLREVASGVKVWLEAAIIRALDLSAYGYATPKRDWWTAGITAGF